MPTPPAAPPPAPEPEQLNFDLDVALDRLADEFIQCRDFGHSWRPYNARLEPKQRLYIQTLRCNRCKTMREREIGMRGQMLGSHYDYPEGYTMKGAGRLTGVERDKIRMRSITKLLSVDTTED